MARVLNRTTFEYHDSANTPDFDPAEWLINPDLSEVEGFATQYWTINPDDTVSLMSEADRANVDTWLPYYGADLEAAIRIKMDMINAYRDVKLNSGWLYKGVHYDSDAISRQNMNGIMTLIGTGYVLPPDFTFRAQNNTDISYTNQTFTVFYQCSCAWVEMVYKTSWYYKGQVKNLTTIPSIATFDYSQGWPEGYSGAA